MIGYSYSMSFSNAFAFQQPGPINTEAPSIMGGSSLGSILRLNRGNWVDASTFTFQWNRNGNPIDRATAENYAVVIADAGASITCTVTAINDNGSTSVTSNFIIIDIIE